MSWPYLDGLDDGSFFSQLLEQNTPWLTELRGCPQDPIHHAEGDVLTHVGLVCSELSKLRAFTEANQDDKQILAWAALLHDIAKPACTIHEENGRISSPGHAAKGALRARKLLWMLDCPFPIREAICGLVLYHMKVFWVLERDDPTRLVREISLSCSCHLLSTLAQADALGRHCPDTQQLLDRVELFRELAKEANCLHTKADFASDTARFQYFQGKWHNPEIAPFEDFPCEVLLLSGPPGAGKDTWIKEQGPDWPVVSLDQIRQELKIPPTASQAKVADVARERARVHLRSGTNFIWNATNLSRMIRRKSLSLFLDYGAKVKIVYLEQPIKILEQRNREREAAVPWKAVEKMLGRWEIPTALEAHTIELAPGVPEVG